MDCPPPTPATADSQPLLAEAVAFFAEPGLGHPPPPVVRTGTTSCHFANKRPRLLAAPPQAAVGEDPVPVDRLPPAFAAGYPFSCFNRLQSACFADLFHADSSMVISAPTASGKTVLMEIAICKLFGAEGAENAAIALYLAPLKALCAEKAAEWSARFRQRGLVCVEATAGSESGAERDAAGPSAIQQLGKAHIVCATPEKWISLARHQDLAPGILDRVSLVLIDECHMVGTSRGPQLELAVAGVRMHNARVRIIAASATVRNIGDISRWLGGTGLGQAPAKTLVFGDEYRPVPLTKTVLGFECHAAYYRFQRNLDFKLPGIINAHCPGSLVLVFCSTRGAAQESCRHLAQSVGQLVQRPMPLHLTEPFTNQLLNAVESVPLGVAFHHAGLSAADRSRVEQLFSSKSISILCSTSTLGIGVNLPASAVIVKGTKGYAGSGYEEYASYEVLQFIGRAGRPQFGTIGKAIVLTETHRVGFYRNLVSGQETLESSLLAELPRSVVAGVYARELHSIERVAQWLRFTFLAVRLERNPACYRTTASDDPCMSAARSAVDNLCGLGLLETAKGDIQITDLGKCVARHGVDPVPMARVVANLPPDPHYQHVLETVCRCGEFDDLRITVGQKGVLNEMNKSPWLKFKVAGRVDSVLDKVFILIQYGLQRRPLPSTKYSSGLSSDMGRALGLALGPAMCIRDAYASQDNAGGVLVSSTFESSPAMLCQVDGIGPRYSEMLWNNGARSIVRLRDMGAREIEHLLGRNPPFGTKVCANAARLPSYTVGMTAAWIDAHSVVFTITVASGSDGGAGPVPTAPRTVPSFTVAAYTSDGLLLKFETVVPSSASLFFETQVGLCNPAPGSAAILEVAPERHVGCGQLLRVPIATDEAPRACSAGESGYDEAIDDLLADCAEVDLDSLV